MNKKFVVFLIASLIIARVLERHIAEIKTQGFVIENQS